MTESAPPALEGGTLSCIITLNFENIFTFSAFDDVFLRVFENFVSNLRSNWRPS